MSDQLSFGKYTVIDRIGAGGMAEVFLCRLVGIGGFEKRVVVKRILPGFARDPEFVRMFLDEGRVAAGLSHQNLIHVYDIDSVDNVPFLAMEYVPGPSFAQILKRAARENKPNLANCLHIIIGMCNGLHYAHNAVDGVGESLGLVHRDVSPHNVLVSTEGVAKVLDFGVAKSKGRLSSQTQAGTIKGKIAYMAPEQAEGSDLDHRADVYSIGVCLYQCATGRAPFVATSELKNLTDLMAGEFPRPSALAPEILPELERIILWAMATKAEERCPSAGALQEALEVCVAGNGLASTNAAVARWITELFPSGFGTLSGNPNAFISSLSPQPTGRPESSSGARAMPDVGRRPGSYSNPGVNPATPVPTAATPVQGVGEDVNMESAVYELVDRPGQVPGGTAARKRARQRRQLLIGGGVAAALLLVASLALALLRPTGPATPSLEEQRASVRQYLSEADRLIKARQFGVAAEMIEKAERSPSLDAKLEIEVTTLANAVARESALEKARQFLAAGDLVQTVQFANVALAKDPTSQEAGRILSEARKASESAAAAASAPAAAAAPVTATPKPTARTAARATPQPAAAPMGGAGFNSDGLLPTNPDSLLPTGTTH